MLRDLKLTSRLMLTLKNMSRNIKLDWTPSRLTRKINSSKNQKRATTNSRPRTESSWRGKSISTWYILLSKYVTPEQKDTKQNQTPPFEHSSSSSDSEVSDPSEMTRFVRGLIFRKLILSVWGQDFYFYVSSGVLLKGKYD